jgi:hypothetical protein
MRDDTIVSMALRILALLLFMTPPALPANPELLTRYWPANWISVPGAPAQEYGVYHFRKTFDLPSAPSTFLVHVTADNRYQLFVNGTRVAWGPARGDRFHWRYESVDIARRLKTGKNVIAAVVWNFGAEAPQAQQTIETGFLLQGDTAAQRVIDTNQSWKCVRDEAYEPIVMTSAQVRGYYVAGPGEKIDAAKYPWGWEKPEFDDSRWRPARQLGYGAPRDARDSHSPWMLVPRPIPMMEEKPEAPLVVRQGGKSIASVVPANTKARLLLDQTYLTTGYPELRISKGRGATVRLGYAEAMFLPGGKGKGNRNEIEGKEFIGNYDLFVADGGEKRTFRTLWWRTWRYLELTVETKDEPLVIEGVGGTYTGYPFQRKAVFDAGSKELDAILDVGWRTARLCAHETYMDCPYYEQLQYVGDTRIQALVSLYMTGDGRLARNAIDLLNSSRTPEGATMSRAPTRLHQYIPGFSLWWIGLVHDYWMYQDDPAFVKRMLAGVRAVLSFFAGFQQRDGSLGPMPWWNYVDWTREWRGGVPGDDSAGNKAAADLQLYLAYQWAWQMEETLGSKALAVEYREAARKLGATIQKLYWDPSRRMFADFPGKKNFSQQANALAAIAGLVPSKDARDLVERVAADPSLVQCSIYFRHYLHEALNRSGGGDGYLDQLGQWRKMLGYGLTTWAETLDPTRSDCHAWGASPNFELFRTVLGIDSAAPGFKSVIVRPHLGKLTKVSGSIPHPKGQVSVRLALNAGKLTAEVILPVGVDGEFEWKGQRRPLKPGTTHLTF